LVAVNATNAARILKYCQHTFVGIQGLLRYVNAVVEGKSEVINSEDGHDFYLVTT